MCATISVVVVVHLWVKTKLPLICTSCVYLGFLFGGQYRFFWCVVKHFLLNVVSAWGLFSQPAVHAVEEDAFLKVWNHRFTNGAALKSIISHHEVFLLEKNLVNKRLLVFGLVIPCIACICLGDWATVSPWLSGRHKKVYPPWLHKFNSISTLGVQKVPSHPENLYHFFCPKMIFFCCLVIKTCYYYGEPFQRDMHLRAPA